MCRIMEEVRQEGYDLGYGTGYDSGIEKGTLKGRGEERREILRSLLLFNSQDTLLHGEQFRGLNITPDELEQARQ